MKANLGILRKLMGKGFFKITLNGRVSLVENLLENLDSNLMKLWNFCPFFEINKKLKGLFENSMNYEPNLSINPFHLQDFVEL